MTQRRYFHNTAGGRTPAELRGPIEPSPPIVSPLLSCLWYVGAAIPTIGLFIYWLFL